MIAFGFLDIGGDEERKGEEEVEGERKRLGLGDQRTIRRGSKWMM